MSGECGLLYPWHDSLAGVLPRRRPPLGARACSTLIVRQKRWLGVLRPQPLGVLCCLPHRRDDNVDGGGACLREAR
jgi:hypothetical protein